MTMRLIAALAASAYLAAAHGAQCTGRSADTTAALVELYTSEGCSSCPPADRWLSSLSQRYSPERVVPIALHVDYWDYIGWKDPYGRREFALRQRKLSQLQRLALVYTPQVVLQGADFRGWAGAEFDRRLAAINARPASAHIELSVAPFADHFAVRASAQVAGADLPDAALYIAAYANGLRSRVTAGENRGRTLTHDYVVLEWLGPFDFEAAPTLAVQKDLSLLPGVPAASSGVAAFVQNRRTGEVLQALLRPAC